MHLLVPSVNNHPYQLLVKAAKAAQQIQQRDRVFSGCSPVDNLFFLAFSRLAPSAGKAVSVSTFLQDELQSGLFI
ncbi:hypothetical protein [Spirosoma arcticum]